MARASRVAATRIEGVSTWGLPWVLVVPLIVVGTARVVGAADIPVAGLKLVVVDKMAAAGSAKAVFVAKDAAITKGPGTDPAQIAATLDVAYDAAHGTFEMPLGSAWVVNKDAVAKYVNKEAPTGGATKVGVIKPGSLAKVVGKSLGDVPLDVSSAPAGDVYVAETIVNAGMTTRLCTRFAGCAYKVIAGGTGAKLVCKGNGTGDPDCTAAAAPATSTTVPPTSTTVPSSTTTTTLPPLTCCTSPFQVCEYTASPGDCTSQGKTPGPAGSRCDASGGCVTTEPTPGFCCDGLAPGFYVGENSAGCVVGNPTFNCAAFFGVSHTSSLCSPDSSLDQTCVFQTTTTTSTSSTTSTTSSSTTSTTSSSTTSTTMTPGCDLNGPCGTCPGGGTCVDTLDVGVTPQCIANSAATCSGSCSTSAQCPSGSFCVSVVIPPDVIVDLCCAECEGVVPTTTSTTTSTLPPCGGDGGTCYGDCGAGATCVAYGTGCSLSGCSSLGCGCAPDPPCSHGIGGTCGGNCPSGTFCNEIPGIGSCDCLGP